MSDPVPDRIAVTFAMTADDYARYFAVRNRHEAGAANFFAYAAALFSAIPVALAFRFIGRRLSGDAAADLIGQFSLAAFLLGTIAIVVAGLFARRIATRRYLAGTLNAFESKTVVFDATGITVTGKLSQTMWQWAAISRSQSGKDLLLVWIGKSTALAIPRRSFASDDAYEATTALIRARLPEQTPN
jgi:hypothetical protein